MKRVLLHVCCGPCTTYPLRALRDEGYEVDGLFYNPNIHPYREFKRRSKTMAQYAQLAELSCELDQNYDLKATLEVLMQSAKRCEACYLHRLERTARTGKEQGFDAFSTTLLVSPYQDHDLVASSGETASRKHGIPFLYRDFRPGWEQGVTLAKGAQLYRQPYCGCVFSEYERFSGGEAR